MHTISDWKQNLCVSLSMLLASYLRSSSQIEHCGGIFWVFYFISGNAFRMHTWNLVGGGPHSGCGVTLWKFFPLACVGSSTPEKWILFVSECDVKFGQLSPPTGWKELARRDPSCSGTQEHYTPGRAPNQRNQG